MDVFNLPKVELHRHLEMSFRIESFFELAPMLGLKLPRDRDEFAKTLVLDRPMKNLEEVLKKFLLPQAFWASPDLIERLTFEAIEDAALNENIRILELRYAPSFIQAGHPHLSFKEIHEAILKGVEKAKEMPISVGLIGIIQRTLPLTAAAEVFEFILDHKDSFVGIDLADNEVGFDCRNFAKIFEAAKSAGLKVTIHSGEVPVEGAEYFVKNAIEVLGAERIGHGLMIHQSEEMMDFVCNNKIPLELCPTSNWLTGAVTKLSDHPFKKLMDHGIRTTINTDDPSTFGTDLNREHQILVAQLALTEEDLRQCNRWAYQASFVRDKERFAQDFN